MPSPLAAATITSQPTTDRLVWRVRHRSSHVAVWIETPQSLWELHLPDTDAELDYVRVRLAEVSAARGAEASVLLPYQDYRAARDWLRCLPNGTVDSAEAEPALKLLAAAFGPFLDVLSQLPAAKPARP